MSKPTIVCVTGASGFVAGPIVDLLLKKGYTVRGTVRSLTDESKVSHLHELAKNAKGTLELFEADLLKEGSFDHIIEGCTYVLHTASPFQVQIEDPQRDLVDPALLGTKNVLNSVIKHKDTVKRVVVTSSVAAVESFVKYVAPKNGIVYTEEDWNYVSTLENDPYCFSKRVAEEEAWKIAKENGLDLVTINPSFVLGPAIFKRLDGMSMKYMKSLLEGGVSPLRFAIVDVRDIAKAHIGAIENPNASGRYIVSQRKKFNNGYGAEIVQKTLPTFKINVEGNKNYDVHDEADQFDNSKVIKELGLQFTPVEQTISEMAQSFIDLGIVKAE